MSPKHFRQRDIIPKIHRKKRRWRLVIEFLFIGAVVVGSLVTFLQFSDVSFDGTLDKFKEVLSIQRETPSSKPGVSTEEKIKDIYDKKILKITSINDSNPEFITFKSQEGTTVVLSTSQDLEEQSKTLQSVLAKAKIEGKRVSLVDFRFDKLVVRYDR